MKMVKSLLLVSAAGIVAVSGAQAADLPVKAKPVEYVKVCSLYGVGFYYVPGTDICLKVGAYFRAEYAAGNMGSSLTNLDAVGADGQRTRTSGPDYQQRARAFIFLDSRQQTAYGTLRAYLNIGHNSDNPIANGNSALTSASAVYANRAFIQIAGFTWGLATSYYDFFSSPATSYSVPWSSDTGDGGWKVAAYTAQLGNGVSASISFEEPRRQIVANTSIPNSYTVGGLPINDELKVRWPDVVANLRVDQAWGSAQIMGALHEVGGGYYASGTTGGTCNPFAGATGFNTCNGAPDTKIGFAVGAGIKLNFPMIGPGDYLQAQVNYTQGALRYAALTPSSVGSPGIFGEGTGQGSTMGLGFFQDGVFCGTSAVALATTFGGSAVCPAGGSSIQLTTAWSVQAAYEHFWTPSLRTSFVGAYTDISYNSTANTLQCVNMGSGASGTISAPGGVAACIADGSSNDWSYYSLSSRTQWNITKDFYVGLEGFYGHLNTMSKGRSVLFTSPGGVNSAQPTGVRVLDDQNVYVYRMRVHRDIVP
jgi:hypothetical protein